MTIPFPPSFQFTSCLCRAVLPSALFVLVLNFHSRADELPGAAGDELPPGLELVISNPAIPIIVDGTITNFTKEGHAEIKVNKIYKAPKASAGKKIAVPEKVRGYLMDGVNPRVVPIKIITDKGKKRFLFFLKGDLLYSTYNNRFEIKEDKTGRLIVHTGRKWQPLADIVKLIPGKVHAQRSCGTRDPSALNGY